MKEPSELIKKRDVSSDAGGPLERPTQYYPSSRYDTYPSESSSGYNRLHEYWRSVRKHLWLILGIIVLVTALTAIYMSRQPDIYESVSRVQVDLETANNRLSVRSRKLIYPEHAAAGSTY